MRSPTTTTPSLFLRGFPGNDSPGDSLFPGGIDGINTKKINFSDRLYSAMPSESIPISSEELEVPSQDNTEKLVSYLKITEFCQKIQEQSKKALKNSSIHIKILSTQPDIFSVEAVARMYPLFPQVLIYPFLTIMMSLQGKSFEDMFLQKENKEVSQQLFLHVKSLYTEFHKIFSDEILDERTVQICLARLESSIQREGQEEGFLQKDFYVFLVSQLKERYKQEYSVELQDSDLAFIEKVSEGNVDLIISLMRRDIMPLVLQSEYIVRSLLV